MSNHACALLNFLTKKELKEAEIHKKQTQNALRIPGLFNRLPEI